MVLLITSTAIFITGHYRENFKKLRTNYLNSEDTLEKEEKSRANEIEIFKTKWTDHVSRILVLILAIFWICLGLKEISVFSVIMTTLALISLVLIIICVNKVFFDSLNRIHNLICHRLEISISDKSKKSQSTDSSREKKLVNEAFTMDMCIFVGNFDHICFVFSLIFRTTMQINLTFFSGMSPLRHPENLLNYDSIIRLCFNGAVERSRTSDLLITNQLLYQLSYNSGEINKSSPVL